MAWARAGSRKIRSIGDEKALGQAGGKIVLPCDSGAAANFDFKAMTGGSPRSYPAPRFPTG